MDTISRECHVQHRMSKHACENYDVYEVVDDADSGVEELNCKVTDADNVTEDDKSIVENSLDEPDHKTVNIKASMQKLSEPDSAVEGLRSCKKGESDGSKTSLRKSLEDKSPGEDFRNGRNKVSNAENNLNGSGHETVNKNGNKRSMRKSRDPNSFTKSLRSRKNRTTTAENSFGHETINRGGSKRSMLKLPNLNSAAENLKSRKKRSSNIKDHVDESGKEITDRDKTKRAMADKGFKNCKNTASNDETGMDGPSHEIANKEGIKKSIRKSSVLNSAVEEFKSRKSKTSIAGNSVNEPVHEAVSRGRKRISTTENSSAMPAYKTTTKNESKISRRELSDINSAEKRFRNCSRAKNSLDGSAHEKGFKNCKNTASNGETGMDGPSHETANKEGIKKSIRKSSVLNSAVEGFRSRKSKTSIAENSVNEPVHEAVSRGRKRISTTENSLAMTAYKTTTKNENKISRRELSDINSAEKRFRNCSRAKNSLDGPAHETANRNGRFIRKLSEHNSAIEDLANRRSRTPNLKRKGGRSQDGFRSYAEKKKRKITLKYKHDFEWTPDVEKGTRHSKRRGIPLIDSDSSNSEDGNLHNSSDEYYTELLQAFFR